VKRPLLLLVLLAALAGCGSDDEVSDSTTAAGEAGTIEFTATEFAFSPENATVDAAGKVTIHVVNNGALTHALEVENDDLDLEEETDEIAPGESADLTVDLPDGEYEIYCPIDDHKSKGMETTLVVGSGGSGGTETDETDTDDDSSGYGG
jgi:uncharacterized cupredoxin-like copper-binding protein